MGGRESERQKNRNKKLKTKNVRSYVGQTIDENDG
jgi:hypothetical protein